MPSLTSLALLAFCLVFPGARAFSQDAIIDGQNPVDFSDETHIREARELFNQAIKRQDIEAITSFFAPGYHIVTGRSAQTHGIENEAQQLKQLFAADPTFVCRRTTREVRVNGGWGLAEELGDWRCDYTVDAEKIHSSGVYAAKWQRSKRNRWLLQSEVFTTLQCLGNENGCQPPDPIE